MPSLTKNTTILIISMALIVGAVASFVIYRFTEDEEQKTVQTEQVEDSSDQQSSSDSNQGQDNSSAEQQNQDSSQGDEPNPGTENDEIQEGSDSQSNKNASQEELNKIYSKTATDIYSGDGRGYSNSFYNPITDHVTVGGIDGSGAGDMISALIVSDRDSLDLNFYKDVSSLVELDESIVKEVKKQGLGAGFFAKDMAYLGKDNSGNDIHSLLGNVVQSDYSGDDMFLSYLIVVVGDKVDIVDLSDVGTPQLCDLWQQTGGGCEYFKPALSDDKTNIMYVRYFGDTRDKELEDPEGWANGNYKLSYFAISLSNLSQSRGEVTPEWAYLKFSAVN